MKKILFIAFAVVAVSFTSCGNKTNSTEAADSTVVDSAVVDSVDTVAVNTIAVDSTVVE